MTGAIDVKFFEAAANAFRAHPALVKGATVRISGFKLFEVKGNLSAILGSEGLDCSFQTSTPDE